MFLRLTCLFVAATCAFAAPPLDVVPLEKQQPTVIPIISQSEELEANGTYKFSYETGNGIKREETSYDKLLPRTKSGPSSNEGGEDSDESNEIHVQQGSYSYTAPDGTVISVRYIADENGFRPIGDHIPKAPSEAPASTGRRGKTINTEGEAPKLASSETPKASEAPKAPEAPAVPEASATPEAPAAPKTPVVPESPKSSETPETPKTEADASKAPGSPLLESRAGESAPELVSTTEAKSEPSTTEASSESTATPESLLKNELASTTESAPSTTEQSTTSEETSAASTEQPTTGAASTPEASSESTTSEASSESTSTPDSEPSTPEVASEQPSTPASVLLTSEASSEPASTTVSEPSSPQELNSTPAEDPSTPNATTAASSDATPETAPSTSKLTN